MVSGPQNDDYYDYAQTLVVVNFLDFYRNFEFSFFVVFACYFGPGAVSEAAGDSWEKIPPSPVQIREILYEL